MSLVVEDFPTPETLTESEQRWIRLAGCSLDTSSGSNWVQEEGGLPEYICRVARSIMKGGVSRERAIPMAIGTMRRWASSGRVSEGGKGGGSQVDAKTRAQAIKALAQWEAMKAKRKSKRSIKHLKKSA